MTYFLHAAAIDYDGTLTEGDRPADGVLQAVRAARDAGRRCILVTGRILSELRAVFPDVHEHFDAIVAENGAVLSRAEQMEHPLASAVDPVLEAVLLDRGVPVRRGRVLLATEGRYALKVDREIARLGLEVSLIRNRAALMILPPGVNKGTGVKAALEELGLSLHNTVGVGDAENDHSLLEACEIGVAVSNAIPGLKVEADVVLAEADGAGIAGFLAGRFLDGLPGVEPRRRQIGLGLDPGGSEVTVPASRVNIEIFGPSGSGKSYVAGLIAEQLIDRRYTVCVLDLEGDHVALAGLHGVVVLGGREALPDPHRVAVLLTQGIASVVVDLSLRSEKVKVSYCRRLLDELRHTRQTTGMPHWIIVEEAHVPLRGDTDGWWCRDPDLAGLCVVTYQPDLVCRHLTERSECVITLDEEGVGMLSRRGLPGGRPFIPHGRSVDHARHWHKYAAGALPHPRHFFFRDSQGVTERTAANVPEFLDAVSHVRGDVLQYHAARGDLSRWLDHLCKNAEFGRRVRELERQFGTTGAPGAVAALRSGLLSAIEKHFPQRSPPGRR